ncbi:hypothetical protein ACFVOR_16265 [Streptomyces sp. NPDC057837]|uniref:hypothetical protein n=1 Tax=Streptomyces sp. NPDC057837 TaxID=3346260 RepID=UPI0036C66BC0
MSNAASVAEWLRAGGIGIGAWVATALPVKVAADASAPRPESPTTAAARQALAPAVPPPPNCPPSTGRHAAGPAKTTTLPDRARCGARHSKGSSWT